jgi:hypothetical protein
MEFSKQKVHDILEAINESLPKDIPFISLFDGHAQQNGDIIELLRGLCAVFPEQFHEVSIERLMESAGLNSEDLPNTMELLDSFESEQGDKSDPTTDAYWNLGDTELDVFKSQCRPEDHDCLDTVQKAISFLYTEGKIDGDGNITGTDLRDTLRSVFGLNEIVNLTEVEWYLEDGCGGLISGGYVTKAKKGRVTVFNFLESPFRLS